MFFALLALFPQAGNTAPISVGGGYDYYRGPGDQVTHGPVGTAAVGFGPLANFSVSGMRYDDSFVGKGTSLTGGVGFPVLPLTQLRSYATRYLGDESYRAWRIKVGPQVSIPTGQSLGVFYSHYRDNGDVSADGAAAELATPLVAGLSARLTAAYAKAEGFKSGQGSVGLSWNPVRNLELSGDVGLARDGATATQPFPSRPGLRLPLIGGDPGRSSSPSSESSLETTVLMGIRVWFP